MQVSNFIEKKGHEYSIQAFSKYLDIYPNFHLILAGAGTVLDKMKNLISQLGINNKVSFPGLIRFDEVQKFFERADVFLHHSVISDSGDMEGIPTVMMEAMSSGLPVLSTYHSGIPELIDDGENGFLVQERDVETYTNKMINILNLDNTIGLNARERILKDFNLDKELIKLNELYARITKDT